MNSLKPNLFMLPDIGTLGFYTSSRTSEHRTKSTFGGHYSVFGC